VFNKKSLTYKLNLYVVSLIAIIAFAILIFLYSASSKMLLSSVEANARNIAEKNVNKMDAIIERSSKVAVSIASVIENTNLNDNEIIEMLKSIVKNNDEIYGSAIAYEPYMQDKKNFYYAPYVYKNSGIVKYKNLNSAQYDYFYQGWYQLPKILHKPVWSQPYYDTGGGNTMMATFAVPVYKTINGKREFIGVMSIDIALDWLEKIVSAIKIYKSGYAFVVSQSGEIITHPNKKFILNESIFSLAEEHHLPQLRETGRRMLRKESGFVRLPGLNGAESRLYYTPFRSNDWSIAILIPESELFKDIYNLAGIILLIGLTGILIIVFTISFVLKKLTRPLISLSAAASQIGNGTFDVALPKVETEDEVGQLNKSFKIMQMQLSDYVEDLKRTTIEKERMQSELRIAHQIQMGLLPKTFPAYPERDDIDMHAFLEPAKEVGGDLYDFFFTDSDNLVMAVGDVSGKGVPASLFMAVTRTLIRSKITREACLPAVVDSINRDLKDDNDTGLFVTLIVCKVNLKTREVEITNAGHNYPYILSKNGNIRQLKDKNGMALGVLDIQPYTSAKHILQHGEKLVFYTDGINEAMDKLYNEYDYQRFEKALLEIKDMTAKQSTEYILKDIRNFTKGAEQSDDMTCLILELK
jgi:phosphoserine phosphatase RsbU/P